MENGGGGMRVLREFSKLILTIYENRLVRQTNKLKIDPPKIFEQHVRQMFVSG